MAYNVRGPRWRPSLGRQGVCGGSGARSAIVPKALPDGTRGRFRGSRPQAHRDKPGAEGPRDELARGSAFELPGKKGTRRTSGSTRGLLVVARFTTADSDRSAMWTWAHALSGRCFRGRARGVRPTPRCRCKRSHEEADSEATRGKVPPAGPRDPLRAPHPRLGRRPRCNRLAAVRARPGRGRRRDVPGHDLAPCLPTPGRGGRGGAGGGDVHGEDARSRGRSHRGLVPSRGTATLGRERTEDRSKAVGPYTPGARPRCRSLPTSRAPDRKPSDLVGRGTDHVCADSIHLHGSSAGSQPPPPGGPNGESRTRSEEPRRKRGNETPMNPIKELPDDPGSPRIAAFASRGCRRDSGTGPCNRCLRPNDSMHDRPAPRMSFCGLPATRGCGDGPPIRGAMWSLLYLTRMHPVPQP